MIQIILGVIIVSIGIFVFYKYPMKSDVRQMTLGALFVILAIILKRLAVMVPFLGFPSLKITLEVLPLIVAGLTLQPGYCFIVSIATDFLGLVLANAGGFPFLGFTLNAVLQTEIPCLLKIYLNEKNERYSLEKYDSIVPFFDEIIIVKKNNLFGYIKKTGEVLLEPQYDEAYPFSEGKAVVRKNGTSFIIDQTGKKLYQFEGNYTSIGHFVNNRLVISNSSSQGYLVYNPDTFEFNYLYNIQQTNELGQNTITHFPYDYCGQFSDECAVVGFVNENGDYKYSHINLNGERLYDKEWDYASDFSEGYAVVGNNITYTLRVYLSKEGAFDDEYRLEHNRYPLTESQKPKIENMSYMYVSKTGRYLGKEIIDPLTKETTIDPYVFSNACSFKDSIAIVSNLCLLSESFKSLLMRPQR